MNYKQNFVKSVDKWKKSCYNKKESKKESGGLDMAQKQILE